MSPQVSLLTYQFPDFYWQTNRVPFGGFRGNLFSVGTCNCVGQSINVVVNFVLSNGHFVKYGLVIVERMAKLMSIQSALWNSLTVFSFILL